MPPLPLPLSSLPVNQRPGRRPLACKRVGAARRGQAGPRAQQSFRAALIARIPAVVVGLLCAAVFP